MPIEDIVKGGWHIEGNDFDHSLDYPAEVIDSFCLLEDRIKDIDFISKNKIRYNMEIAGSIVVTRE